MKILLLSDDFPPQSFGGAGISTYELALGMRKAGQEVCVVTTCRKREDAGESDYNGVRVFRIASNYPSKWRWYVSLYNRPAIHQLELILKKIKPDVVHVNNVHLYISYYSIKLSKRIAKVVVWTGRDVMAFNFSKLQTKKYLENFDCRTTWLDHLHQAKKRWNPLRNFFIKRYLRLADKLYAVSGALAKALDQNGIRGVEVMHTGVDLDLWRIDKIRTDQFKKKYNLENKKVILFGGRLSEAKGAREVLKAMADIAKSLPDAVLLIVSKNDGYSERMKAEAIRLGIGDRMIFTGWIEREEIKYTYVCADVVLVPSVCFDAFPRIVLEAMASGRPVVGTCYGGAPEIIVDGVTGFVVNPFNFKEMAEKTLVILGDQRKKESFGSAGYERVKSDFNSNKKIESILACYRELIKEKVFT